MCSQISFRDESLNTVPRFYTELHQALQKPINPAPTEIESSTCYCVRGRGQGGSITDYSDPTHLSKGVMAKGLEVLGPGCMQVQLNGDKSVVEPLCRSVIHWFWYGLPLKPYSNIACGPYFDPSGLEAERTGELLSALRQGEDAWCLGFFGLGF